MAGARKSHIGDYFSLVTFSHTIFAMPFAIIGFFLAVKWYGVSVNWWVFLLVILCMIFARNAAMGYNRFADQHIDKKNQRTMNREIPAGIIKPRSAVIFIVTNSMLFILSAWFINPICFFLSPVALLIILGYSYAKRFTTWVHLILGLGLAIAPIGAFIAVTGEFNYLPILFSAVVLTWVSGFDIIYATQDIDFDQQERLHSIPVRYGLRNGMILSIILHVVTSILVMIVGLIADFTYWYFIGGGIFIIMLIYQHSIVKPQDLSKVNKAFGVTNGIASVVFAIFVLLELFL